MGHRVGGGGTGGLRARASGGRKAEARALRRGGEGSERRLWDQFKNGGAGVVQECEGGRYRVKRRTVLKQMSEPPEDAAPPGCGSGDGLGPGCHRRRLPLVVAPQAHQGCVRPIAVARDGAAT